MLFNNRWTLIILVFGVLMIFFFIKYKMRGLKDQCEEDIEIPSNLWFYSKLIDVEINGKEDLLISYLNSYLERKLFLNISNFSQNNIFTLIENSSIDSKEKIFLKNLFVEIYNISNKSDQEIVEYVKSIKHNFQKSDINEWLIEYRRKKNCNDC